MRTVVPGKLAFTYRALKYRNYRLFFSGQILSLVGTWLSVVATSWLVYRLSHGGDPARAAAILGIVAFASQLPSFFVTPIIGVWIDRLNRHTLLLWTQGLSMLQSFAMAYLTLGGHITIPQIIALAVFQGFINAVDMPTRQAFVIELVDDRKDLGNAIALNSSMIHTARMVGPSVAGFLIYHFGEGVCFLVDGVSYLFVLIALAYVKVKSRASRVNKSPFAELKEGILYSARSPAISALLLLVATASLMFVSLSVLMPIVADRILGGDEKMLGILFGGAGMGAFFASIYLASRASVVGLLSRVILYAMGALGTTFFLLALSKSFVFTVAILVITGGSTVLLNASCNTILQTIVDDHMRGRVMSLFGMAFLGTAPFGSLFCGYLASAVGVPATFAVCGAVCLFSALLFRRRLPRIREHIRPIYQAKGLIPPPPEMA